MNLRKLYYLLLLMPFLFFVACEDDPVTPPETVNESEVLVKYLEANGDFINTLAPAMITAADVNTLRLTNPTKLLVIDIRSAADFANKGHIEGAVNKTLGELVAYMESINTTSYEKIVLACYSGQTAAYATSLLRLLGYSNVYDLKFGMSSWNSAVATSWNGGMGNNYTNFVTTATAKGAAGSLPKLSTGKKTGEDILKARVAAMLSTADPFGDVKIAHGTLTPSLSNYYIVNYWPENHYNLGHLPNSIQYTPKVDLKLDVNLKTLPTDKTIVVWCYTGQTSAHIAAYLKLLGYDAKTLLNGVNILNYDWAKANGLTVFKPDTDVMGYPYVTGN